jgi:hypothetical protein
MTPPVPTFYRGSLRGNPRLAASLTFLASMDPTSNLRRLPGYRTPPSSLRSTEPGHNPSSRMLPLQGD